jgi:hypothetical protein
MASTYKPINNEDVTNTRTLLHEAIPITGTIISGTYNEAATLGFGNETNIKNYSHGMFQSVYDYPYLSSSANHIFDLTVGYGSGSSLSSSTSTQNAKKINIYNQMSSVLMGHDISGNILPFDEDGNISAGGTKIKEAFFINFSRLLSKDEIKKGSFQMVLGTTSSLTGSPYADVFQKRLTIQDSASVNNYKVNSPSGEYGILSCSNGGAYDENSPSRAAGLIFYQAGIAVLTASIFLSGTATNGGKLNHETPGMIPGEPYETVNALLTGSISGACDALRNRIQSISFNNTTELNSSIYFCKVGPDDFNYSANPTYVSSSKINVKNSQSDAPVSYVTTVGLYSDDKELLAVAKLSEPLKNDPNQSMTIRVRLDY